MYNTFLLYSHVIIGSIGFIAGVIALLAEKGSHIHKTAGKVFVIGILYSIVTTFIFAFTKFLPLALVLGLGCLYFMMSAINAVRYKGSNSELYAKILLVLPIVLFGFVILNIVRIFPQISFGMLARLLLFSLFALSIWQDIQWIRKPINRPSEWLDRHLFRMIMALSFAFMAVLRIGVKVDFIDLELTVIIPLLIGVVLTQVYRRKYRVKS